jgi:multicomponent Na+:H+ antiporter subunit B
MNSIVLQAATRFLITLLLLFAVFLLVRGHNEPGGGFIAGLVVASAIALYGLSSGIEAARRLLRFDPRLLIAVGLAVGLISAVPGIVDTGVPLDGVWREVSLPGDGKLKLGSPLLFDLGVFVAVVGAAVTMLLSLSEEA